MKSEYSAHQAMMAAHLDRTGWQVGRFALQAVKPAHQITRPGFFARLLAFFGI